MSKLMKKCVFYVASFIVGMAVIALAGAITYFTAFHTEIVLFVLIGLMAIIAVGFVAVGLGMSIINDSMKYFEKIIKK